MARWQYPATTEPITVPAERQEGGQPPEVGVFFPSTTLYQTWAHSPFPFVPVPPQRDTYPDYIFRRQPNNVVDSTVWVPNVFYPERPQVDKFGPHMPDYIFRRTPNNVGDSFFWGVNTPPAFSSIGFSYGPDILFKRPPNNVTDTTFWDPNIVFPETITLDKWKPIMPDILFRRQPNNVGESEFWSTFTPVSLTSLNLVIYQDYINRRFPNNVGESFFWGELETAPEPERGFAFYPDYIFRRAPNNVGDTTLWVPNVIFNENITADKWQPVYPFYVYKLPRLNDYPPLAFWNPNTPTGPTIVPPILLFDITKKRFYIQITRPPSGPPLINPL